MASAAVHITVDMDPLVARRALEAAAARLDAVLAEAMRTGAEVEGLSAYATVGQVAEWLRERAECISIKPDVRFSPNRPRP